MKEGLFKGQKTTRKNSFREEEFVDTSADKEPEVYKKAEDW
jgi:hypothetical protein